MFWNLWIHGTTENTTCMLDNVVQCPPGTFGFMGIENMYFQQPVLFLAEYLNTTLQITYTLFSTNTADVAANVISSSQCAAIVLTDFTSTSTFNSVPFHVVLSDIFFDGSSGYILASYLDCLLATLNNSNRFPVLVVHELESIE